MIRLVRRLAVVWLFVAAVLAAPGQSARAARPETEDEADKKRAEIWEALEKELPNTTPLAIGPCPGAWRVA